MCSALWSRPASSVLIRSSSVESVSSRLTSNPLCERWFSIIIQIAQQRCLGYSFSTEVLYTPSLLFPIEAPLGRSCRRRFLHKMSWELVGPWTTKRVVGFADHAPKCPCIISSFCIPFNPRHSRMYGIFQMLGASAYRNGSWGCSHKRNPLNYRAMWCFFIL